MTTKIAKKLKNRRAPGLDNIHNEMLKYGGKELHDPLNALFNKIVRTGSIPTEWKKSITLPIFKKGDKKAPENYRRVTLSLAQLTQLSNEVIHAHSGDHH